VVSFSDTFSLGEQHMNACQGSIWGPHPKYAVLPVLLVVGVVGWVAYTNPGPVEVSAAQKVTVMKPVEGMVPGIQEVPIEAVYGVPTERTMHLWPEH
jgi:hypothetical protein